MRGVIACSLLLVVCACQRDPDPYIWPVIDAAPLDVEETPVYVPPPSASVSAAPPPAAPPAEVPPFAEGYLERQSSACWMTPVAPEPCSEHAPCKKPALTWSRVTCPPTLAKHDKKHVKPPKNMPPAPRHGYTERVVATDRCWHAARVPAPCQGTKCVVTATEVRCP